MGYKQYCKDYENIENYKAAKKDNFKGWECHHRLETHTSDGKRREVDITADELKALDMYYNRPASELIFLTRSEHHAFKKGENNPFYGKKHSEESKQKMAKAGKKNIGKHWYTDGKIEIYDFNCPNGFADGRLNNSNKNIGKHWFTNDTDNYFGLECPYGYHPGFTISEIKKEAIRKRNSANIKYERTDELINDVLTLNCASFSKKYNCSRSTYKRIRKEIKSPEQYTQS